jgi:release factor glutamine methyltransferase
MLWWHTTRLKSLRTKLPPDRPEGVYYFASRALPTISEAITIGAQTLREAGLSDERRTAALLLRHILSIDQAQLLIHSNQPLEPEQYDLYLRLIARRAKGEPVQYITGHQEFYGLDFSVNPDVLIPRPETELLVERVITLARHSPHQIIADIGTGSGCIAVSLAVNIPDAQFIATDISSSALEVARANAQRHRVADRIKFLQGDMLKPLVQLRIASDIIASNPPYVPDSYPELLQREVRDYEPQIALYGGREGLDFACRLLADGKDCIKRGGHMVIEIGYGQLDKLRPMINPADWELIDVAADLQSIPRTLTLRKL